MRFSRYNANKVSFIVVFIKMIFNCYDAGDLRCVFMSRFLVSRKLAEEDYRTEHNNNMPLNLEKPINLEMRGAESRRHSDRDSGICSFIGARTLLECMNLAKVKSSPWPLRT